MVGRITIVKDVIRTITPDGVSSLQSLLANNGHDDIIREIVAKKVTIKDNMNNDLTDLDFVPSEEARLSITATEKGG